MKQVFISYSSKEFQYADRVCRQLEEAGISCWMAPRDIIGGKDYASVIPQAIRECDYFFLLLSEASMNSHWVARELDRAINEHKRILPFELEHTELRDNFAFYLANVQRYPGYLNYKKELNNVIEQIQNGDAGTVYAPYQPRNAADKPKTESGAAGSAKQPKVSAGKNRKKLWLALAAAACVALVVGAVFLIKALTRGGAPENGSTDALASAAGLTAPVGDGETEPVNTPVASAEPTDEPTSSATPDPVSDSVFDDPAFTEAFWQAYGLKGNFPLSVLDSFTELDLSGYSLCDISDITKFKNLRVLTLGINDYTGDGVNLGNEITDLSPLSELTGLEALYLDYNNITDLEPLRGLTSLRVLSLYGNPIRDVSPLAELTNLETLVLSNTEVADLSPLTSLSKLTYLHCEYCGGFGGLTSVAFLQWLPSLEKLFLANNDISDVSPLSALTSLTVLDLSENNRLSDISPLAGLTNLEQLSLNRTGVSDLSAISGLIKLTVLNCNGNLIDDLSSLRGLTNLKILNLLNNRIFDLSPLSGSTGLITLAIGGNEGIIDLSPLSGLESLKVLVASSAGIRSIEPLAPLSLSVLYLNDNRISDLSPLSEMTALQTLVLSMNNISDLTALSGLTGLNELSLSYNYGISNLEPLKGLSNLKVLDLDETAISRLELEALQEALPGCHINADPAR